METAEKMRHTLEVYRNSNDVMFKVMEDLAEALTKEKKAKKEPDPLMLIKNVIDDNRQELLEVGSTIEKDIVEYNKLHGGINETAIEEIKKLPQSVEKKLGLILKNWYEDTKNLSNIIEHMVTTMNACYVIYVLIK